LGINRSVLESIVNICDQTDLLHLDCKNLLSQMLEKDPLKRASMSDIMSHPWMLKGFGHKPDIYLPDRTPLELPLDPKVIQRMQDLGFGSSEHTTSQLQNLLTSKEYQQSHYQQTIHVNKHAVLSKVEPKNCCFSFLNRKRDAKHSSVDIASEVVPNPINSFDPLISVYFLVREKMQREQEKEQGESCKVKT
jgi:serine/threonine protein kinase